MQTDLKELVESLDAGEGLGRELSFSHLAAGDVRKLGDAFLVPGKQTLSRESPRPSYLSEHSSNTHLRPMRDVVCPECGNAFKAQTATPECRKCRHSWIDDKALDYAQVVADFANERRALYVYLGRPMPSVDELWGPLRRGPRPKSTNPA